MIRIADFEDFNTNSTKSEKNKIEFYFMSNKGDDIITINETNNLFRTQVTKTVKLRKKRRKKEGFSCCLSEIVFVLPRKKCIRELKEVGHKRSAKIINRMKLDELLEILYIKYHESNTKKMFIAKKSFEIARIVEALHRSIIFIAEKTTVKTN